jgi:hypothetical protein
VKETSVTGVYRSAPVAESVGDVELQPPLAQRGGKEEEEPGGTSQHVLEDVLSRDVSLWEKQCDAVGEKEVHEVPELPV